MADTSGTATATRTGPGRRRGAPADAPPQIRDTDRIDRLLRQAVALGASDMHIEPLPGGGSRIRLRVDNVLVDHAEAARTVAGGVRRVDPFPMALADNLRGRIASKSNFDLDPLSPQDGAMADPVAARVATVPTVEGVPLMVLRLFPEEKLHTLRWESVRDEKVWDDMTTGRGGLILVSGPTGSGKSTTVFNALEGYIAKGRAVSTIEDPVEYRLPGARQAEVTARAGFAEILRGMARADSDVVFVGELRDAETADTSITAANRGRTVFSTVHAIDAASTPASLEALGVDMRKLSNVLGGVVAQRLVRRCCLACSGTGGAGDPDGGCGVCQGSGYYGRIAVREVMKITDEVRDAIRRSESPTAIARLAAEQGMTTMRGYAERLVADGTTTESEMKENIG